MVAVAFLNKLLNIGIVFGLKTLFQSWKEEFGAEGSDEIYEYNLEGMVTVIDVSSHAARNGSILKNVSTADVSHRAQVTVIYNLLKLGR